MAVNKSAARQLEPTYAVADLFPPQGQWTEEEYLALNTNRLVELSDSNLEVLEIPTDLHQLVLERLFVAVYLLVTRHRLGHVRFSPLHVRLRRGKFREPDLIFMAATHANRIGEKYWGVPDLVAEVLSPSDPDRDRITKKKEYAQAGIPEYWIVDPEGKTVEVYLLRAKQYRLSGRLGVGDVLTSKRLPGLELSLAELFAEE